MKLKDYIKLNYESKADFARSQGVSRQLVNGWIKSGYRVDKGWLYVRKRELKK